MFLALFLLLVISIAVTYLGLEWQKQAAQLVSLADQQRLLLQQMTSQAQSLEGKDETGTMASLSSAADAFEQNMNAFIGGGQIQDDQGKALEIIPVDNPALKSELEKMQKDWQDYRSKIDLLIQPGGGKDVGTTVKELVDLSPATMSQADRVLRAFETLSSNQVNRLRIYQVIFLLIGLALLAAGWWIIYRPIVQPSPLTSRPYLQLWTETLEKRVQQRTRELEALAAVSKEINSHLSINGVLSSVTEKAQDLLSAEVASLCLLDPEGKVLSLHAASGPEVAIKTNQSPADGPVVGMVLNQHCAHSCGLQNCQDFCLIIDPAYRTSHLAAPIYARDQVIGALCVGSSKGAAFRSEMMTVLAQLTDVASVAIENSRLYQQAEYAATLEERQRIASEMHDGLLQTLSFLRMMVRLSQDHLSRGDRDKAIGSLQQIERAEEQAEGEIRRAIASLQEDFPLTDTLQERLSGLIKDLATHRPPVEFESEVLLPLILSRQESEQVLRVVQEAVLNAQRYSGSEKVQVRLEKSGEEVILTIRDQGVGFTPGELPADGRSHFGMRIMEARAGRLGGKLSIQSAPGAGTAVILSWQLSQTDRN